MDMAASKSREPSWDIFINHHGSDVKHTLATDIYNTLHSMEFSVFLDKHSLEPGDFFPAEIKHAINSASLHIVIFSPNYPKSRWCLDELALMLKTGKKIIPIFYHVDPSDLRWIEEGKGWYAHVFSEHKSKGRYKPEQLDEWKEALGTCSFFHGYPVNNEKDTATVLKSIVNEALKITKRKGLLSVAKHPVGLDELVQEFESLTENVKIRGIVGRSGSGKTTLAKEIFKRKFSSFERCSFVSDVRDAASRNALIEKQKELLKDLGEDDFLFRTVDEGKDLLAKFLSSHRVLIVLDDVDHIEQLEALLPNKGDLESQSLVIVTTRVSRVLESFGTCIHRMQGLDKSPAEQLFCWHAFLQPSPPAEFQSLVEDFVKACNGLPLSLKVFGALLYGRKSRDYWKSQLHKIMRIIPREPKQRLQVSYDALDEEEREMFLDVACFFTGEKKSRAIAVWDRLGWDGLSSFERLVNKCLVDVGDGERIMMHVSLRDLGRQIATRESPYRLRCAEKFDRMKEHSTAEQILQVIEEAQADEKGKGVTTAESSEAGPSRTDGQRVEDFGGEIKGRDSTIARLEREKHMLQAERSVLQRQLAEEQQDGAKRKREMLRLESDRDEKESLVQELHARVTRRSAELESVRMERDMAMRLFEGQGMEQAFTQLVDVATRMDRAHKESNYYRGLYERVVPLEQREPPFAEGSFVGHQ